MITCLSTSGSSRYSQHHAHRAHLLECRHAKTSQVARTDREVGLARELEAGGLLVVHDGACEVGRVLRRERLARHRRHLAVDFHRRREAGSDEEVRTALANHQAQQVEHEF
jgi:hypothetical protein